MPSYIYFFPTVKQALTSISGHIAEKEKKSVDPKSAHPDLLMIKADPSITIDQVRMVRQFFSKKPLIFKCQYTIFNNAGKMTVEAQNALLKTLEELRSRQHVFLITNQLGSLLPTVHSRSIIIKNRFQLPSLPPEKIVELKLLWQNIKTAGPGQRLKLMAVWGKERETALTFCRHMAIFLRSRLVSPKTADCQSIRLALTQLNHCRRQLQANCQVRLALDNWALSI